MKEKELRKKLAERDGSIPKALMARFDPLARRWSM
jgi:hypothetical protein